mmetsp:Transcript_4173/g.4706  ORF Transcript_4173/g.4706 Transcript_4173/m.4706 type:complete len:108 (-) Transcript_4173:294-617(-)
MMSLLLKLLGQQQEQQKRNIDLNERTFARLEQNNRRKVNRESMLAGQTEVQCQLMYLLLTPTDVLRETSVIKFSGLIFLDKMKKLVESKNKVNVLNQIRQHAESYAC